MLQPIHVWKDLEKIFSREVKWVKLVLIDYYMGVVKNIYLFRRRRGRKDVIKLLQVRTSPRYILRISQPLRCATLRYLRSQCQGQHGASDRLRAIETFTEKYNMLDWYPLEPNLPDIYFPAIDRSKYPFYNLG